jgi:hypothetical protein|tara:strand:- start:542 stop:880 length:339 start_codon:yes stop_codon:yes gene_type:complete
MTQLQNKNLNIDWSNPKTPKAKKDPKFLSKLHEMDCCICKAFNLPQSSPTQAHHIIHDRFSGKKTADNLAIPLCEGHHQGLWDSSKLAIHQSPKEWRDLYGPDWSYSQEIDI